MISPIPSNHRLEAELDQERRLNVTLSAKLILRERHIADLRAECVRMHRTRVFFVVANVVTFVGLAYFAALRVLQ